MAPRGSRRRRRPRCRRRWAVGPAARVGVRTVAGGRGRRALGSTARAEPEPARWATRRDCAPGGAGTGAGSADARARPTAGCWRPSAGIRSWWWGPPRAARRAASPCPPSSSGTARWWPRRSRPTWPATRWRGGAARARCGCTTRRRVDGPALGRVVVAACRPSVTWEGARRTAASLTEVARSSPGSLTDGDFWYATAAKLLAPLLLAAATSGRTMADVVRWVDTQEVDEVFDALSAVGDSGPRSAGRAGGVGPRRPPTQRRVHDGRDGGRGVRRSRGGVGASPTAGGAAALGRSRRPRRPARRAATPCTCARRPTTSAGCARSSPPSWPRWSRPPTSAPAARASRSTLP